MGRTMSSREIIMALKKLGWRLVGTQGDHFHFEHPTQKGKVTIPHPVKTIAGKLLKSIEKQAGQRLK